MNGSLSVQSIDRLHNDSAMITNCSERWAEKVKEIYTTVNELKKSWAGEFSRKYTDEVEKAQPDLVDFANVLNRLSTTLTNVSNMFKATEENGDVRTAERLDATVFDLTELDKTVADGDLTFTASDCKEKAGIVNAAAGVIEEIVEEVHDNIEAINSNYESESGTELIGKVRKMKEVAPEYIQAMKDFSNFLINNVAPQYEAIEKYAASGE